MFGYAGFRTPNIWSEMDRIARQLDRAAGAARTARNDCCVFPPLNVYDDGESFVVRAEIPGVDPDKLEVHATADTLKLRGERARTEPSQGASTHRRERDHGVFDRSLHLPQPVDPDKIRARYELGVLEVMLPKAEDARPRRIQVQG